MPDQPFTLLDQAILDGVVDMPTVEEDRYEQALADLALNGRAQLGDFELRLEWQQP
jgi:hypothetical protein